MKRANQFSTSLQGLRAGGLALLLAASAAGAQETGQRGFGPGGPGEGFMADAETACQGKQAGAAVTLTGLDGQTIEAVCTERPAVLLAIPKAQLERMAAAKAACKGLSDGAVATLTTPEGQNVAATCKLHHGELVAVPNERPRKR